MMVYKNSAQDEAVKSMMYTFSILHYNGEPLGRTLLMSIERLQDYYRETGNQHFIELAEWELLAYLSLGFSIPHNSMIEQFIQERNIREKAQYEKRGKKVLANKSQVRAMIGKWMPSRTMPMTIGEVVDDIIEKVNSRSLGTWQYTYRRKSGDKNDMMSEERYELIITEQECFFWDLKNNKFFIFEEDTINDTNCNIG